MLGLDAAGKTTLLYRLKMGETVTTIPTIGFNVESLQIKNLHLTIWDVGGQEKIRPLWKFYLDNIQGLIFVLDSSDTSRLTEVKEELNSILSMDSLKNVPLLILCNKQDIPHALPSSEIAKILQINSKRNKWTTKDCCGLSGSGLSEAFDWLAEEISKRKS
jgi:ADP-ribosylation factor protein 1